MAFNLAAILAPVSAMAGPPDVSADHVVGGDYLPMPEMVAACRTSYDLEHGLGSINLGQSIRASRA
jgi:hypothetical protein